MIQSDDIDLPPARRSLSARLLVLAIVYVMVSEVFIYVPSIHRFRVEYLQNRLADGHLAVLALDASPNRTINDRLTDELLRHAQSDLVILHGYGARTLMLERRDIPQPKPMFVVDLRSLDLVDGMIQAMEDVFRRKSLLIRVIGPSPKEPRLLVESVMTTDRLQTEIRAFSRRILALSIVISLATAGLIYISLQFLMVRPMRRLTQSMIRFRDVPEDASRILVPEKRSDEIGIAQRALAEMQSRLRLALAHRARLAALGTAMAKINHDLRNILATVQLVADSLTASTDPKSIKMASKLTNSVERAQRLVEQILEFARGTPATMDRQSTTLQDLIDKAYAEVAPNLRHKISLRNHIPGDLLVFVDLHEAGRIFLNLIRNAIEAGAKTWDVRANADDAMVTIICKDDGPGVPQDARRKLFEPFTHGSKAGGTGLGLVIARDIARAHGGDVIFDGTSQSGAVFKVILPRPKSHSNRFVATAT
ncbi:MAG: HAMP domain-containing sensor histidine kinase [Alphaproteobacteria bacterium]